VSAFWGTAVFVGGTMAVLGFFDWLARRYLAHLGERKDDCGR